MLRFDEDRPFAVGRTTYRFAPVSETDASFRVIAPISVQGVETEAVIDTGGVYLICSDQLRDDLDLDLTQQERIWISIRGHRIRGSLIRLPLTFLSEQGENHTIEVVAFIPDPAPGRIWDIPSFLGMQGCLEHIRFAVDPGEEQFYFGPVDWRA